MSYDVDVVTLLRVEVTQPSFTAAQPLTAEQDASMNLALLVVVPPYVFVVVPLFLACYGGSCVAYVIYKTYRHCNRRNGKSHSVNLDNMENNPTPTAFPAYFHAPGQPLPPPTQRDGYAKTPASYDPPSDVAADLPIGDILMKKVAQKSSATAY